MRRVIGFLILGVGAVWLAWWMAGLPGTVTVSLAGLTIETATPLALLGVAVLVLLLLIVLRFIGWLVGAPDRIGFWQRRRRRDEGDAASTRALVAIAAGDAATARRESARARRLLGDQAQPLLLAAEAERLGGDEAAATKLFEKLAARPDGALLGLRGLYRQAAGREDWVEARRLAEQAELAHPGGTWLREERERLAVRGGDWRQALALAGPEAPRADYAVARADAEPDAREALKLAKQAFRENPGFPPAAMAYARRLRAAGREDRAFETLCRAWTAAPQPDLATFALEPLTDSAQRIRMATRLVSGRADDPESHLVLAHVYLDAGDPAAARRHMEAARAKLDQRRIWVLLADIESVERGETEAGRVAQRDALRHAATAPPDSGWRCEACGTMLPGWRPVCPVCQTAGRVRWGAPARTALALPS
jgi:HemY protein